MNTEEVAVSLRSIGETSHNVGGVKNVFEHTYVSTHGRAPFRSRGLFARFQPGLALNRSGQPDHTKATQKEGEHDARFFPLGC